jgi:hypothetical protein
MISSRTIKPVDDVRLTTGETFEETRGIVTFSTVEMVIAGVNGGLEEDTSYHLKGSRRSKGERMKYGKTGILLHRRIERSKEGRFEILLTGDRRIEWSCLYGRKVSCAGGVVGSRDGDSQRWQPILGRKLLTRVGFRRFDMKGQNKEQRTARE